MEVFTFLKYWRGGANVRPTVTEIVTAPVETDGDGPFFDLEFGVENENEPSLPEPDSSDSETEEEFNVPVSPSNNLFFEGEPIPGQTGTDPDSDSDSDPNIKSQFSRLKLATNFRVLMPKLKKNKEISSKKTEKVKNETKSKFSTIKFKLEETRIKSVFKRDNSLKSRKKSECTEEKKVSRDVHVMQRYLKMVRIVKRNGGDVAAEMAVASPRGEVPVRRDDSLVQQQDGIQGAILYCKTSFNSSRDSELPILSQSDRDLSFDHKSINAPIKNCSEEAVESSL